MNRSCATAFLGIDHFGKDIFSFCISFLKMIASVMSTIAVCMMLRPKITSISFLRIRLPLLSTPTSTFVFLSTFYSVFTMFLRFVVYIVSNILLFLWLLVWPIRIFLFLVFCSLFYFFSWFLLERMITLKSFLDLYYLFSNFFLLNSKIQVKKGLQHLEDRYSGRKNVLIKFYLTTH